MHSGILQPPSTPHSPKKNLQVRFGNLPRVDRTTGLIINTNTSWPAPHNHINHHPPTQTSPTRSSIAALDIQNELRRKSNHLRATFRDTPPKRSKWGSLFREIQWFEDPHPGSRIPVDPYEGDSVSPSAKVVSIPAWDLEAEEAWFRFKVQPNRGLGRRRPGMRIPAKRGSDEFDEGQEPWKG